MYNYTDKDCYYDMYLYIYILYIVKDLIDILKDIYTYI